MNTNVTFDRCLTYLGTQLNPHERRPHKPGTPTVTLSRMAGAGGTAVADRLAAILEHPTPGSAPWTVFDRALIERALAEHHLPSSLSRFIPEDRASYITDTLEELFGLHPSTSTLVTQVSETILHLAEVGGCILVGRGANLILAKCPTALHVRLIGSTEARIQRIVETRNVSPSAASDIIRTEDRARRRYIKSYFGAEIDNPLLYHLVIHTDTLPADAVAEIIAHALRTRFNGS